MLNKMHKNYDVNKKYGIRKFTVGVFSVALGLIIVPEVGNIDFNGNIVKHEAKAAETTNVQLSGGPVGYKVLDPEGTETIEFAKNSYIKSKENIINKTLNFTNKNTIEENRVFENPNNEKIKYGINIETRNIVYAIKNNKIFITKPNKAKIEYRLLPVNTYSITEVEKGKYQIKHNYIINRATEDIYPFLKSLQEFNDRVANSPVPPVTIDPEIKAKIKTYVLVLKNLREAEIRNNGISSESDITRMINLLKEASAQIIENYSVHQNFSEIEDTVIPEFKENIDNEMPLLSPRIWQQAEINIKDMIYGKNNTYSVVRKEDNKEVGTFEMNEKGVSNTLTLPDGEYKIVEDENSGNDHALSTFAEDKDLTVRTVENSTDQVIYQATYNGKDIGNKVIVEQDGERVGKQYTVSLEEQEDKDTGLVYRPKQSSYTGTVKATNGITRVEYEPVMVNGPITFKPPFKSQVPIELFPEGSVQKGTVSKVTLTDITDENGTVWTPNITKPRAGKIDEITYSIKEVRGKSLEQEQLEQGWQKAQRTDKVEIDYGNYLLIGSFSAPRFDGTIASPAVYMFDKKANKDITHVYADRYNWSVWDSAQIVRGANKSLFKYDLNKASFYKKDNSLKAIVETADGRIETILSKGSHGGILVETKYTNKQGKTVNFGYSRYVDTYLDKNDRVSVFSLGNNDGVYMETDKYRLDYFMKVPDAPDNFDSRFYNKLSGIETNGRKDTPDMMTPNTLLLSKTVDSGIQMGWKDKPLADGETRTMAVEVKLSFASKINSEFSRNRESWDTNTTSRELYPNMPIKYDLTGTINPELLGNFTKATVSITIPEGISLVNNSVSILNGDNSVKSTLQGTYNANTRTFTVEVPKAETSNNSFKMRLNIRADQNVSKSYTFTEKIDVDNDINAGEKTNKSILNIIQNTRTVSVRYVDEQGNILKDSVISSQQRGTRYDVNSVNKPTTLNFNDVSYSYVRTNGSLTGTLTDNTVISHVYRPTRGANITVKYLAGTTEVVAPLVLEGNLNARIPTVNKPDVIRKNGKLYKLSTNNTDFSNTRFTNSTQSFTVNYDELATANYSYKKVINKNGVLETLGDPTVIYREGDKVGTSYNLTAPETFSLNGKKYKIKNIADKNIFGQVKGTETTPVKNIEYNEVISSPINYQPVFRNSPLGTPKVIANTDTVVGSNYNVVPEEIIVNGIKYVPKNNRALTGVIDSGKTINIEYEEKQGNSRISYQPKFNGNNLGSPISVENQITNRREGANFEISPNNEITIDNKVYKLKNPIDKVRGTITQSPQTKEIEYVAKNSTNSTTYQPKLNGNNLGNTIEITPITQVGTSYNVVPKDITVDGKVYEPVSKNALTGRVAENNTPVSVNYQPKLSVNALNYQPKVNGQSMGTPIEIVSRNSQIGTPYNVVPKDITVNGKVYEAISKNALIGRTTPTNTPLEVEYRAKQGNSEISYQPKLNGSNLGTPISVKDQITDKQEGASFVVSPNNEITVDNKVYKLKTPTDKVRGTITQSPQTKEIEYVAKNSNNNLAYQPKFNGNNLGNNIEITPITQIGTSYNVVPKDITVDGKVYEPTSKNALTGRVSENNTPINVNYQPKLSSNVLNYQPKLNGQPIGNPIEVVPSNSQIGTPYNVVPRDIVVNGKTYEPVSKNALTGRTTESNTPLEVEYREKQGNTEISYQPKFNGNNLGNPISVSNQITSTQEGSTFEVSPNNEITVDNKVYKLKTPTDKVRGTITQSPQTKEIEYVAKNSTNPVVYQPKFNSNNLDNSIEIVPSNTQVGTSYDVAPREITVDGKVYEPVVKTNLTGRVLENNTPIEVNYQPKLSNTALNYQPKVNGNPIGNPLEVVPGNSQIGTPYNVVPKDITVNGKVYEPVSKDALTGRTTESNTPLEVEYRAKQGNDEISYQPKFNGNDLGTPVSVKDQITDKQEGANFEISPNSEITIDNKVYKLKTPTDKVSGTITQSPQVKEIEYVAKDSNNNLTYQPKLNGSNLGDNIEITPITQIGTSYNVVPKNITVDGKVYEPVSKDALTGRVSENNTPLEVNYQPKLSANALNYQPKVNGNPIGNPIELVSSNSQVGTPYDVTPKDIIVNGKVYEPVVKDNLTGRTTDANTPIEVEYRAKQGNSEINYQPKFNGNNLGTPISVKDQITDKQEGANFEVSPNSEITVDNKVYKLKTPTDKVSGTITQSPQTKEIEYVEKNSSNGTSYQPKFNNANLGTPIEITPITQVGTSYNVVPKDITVDGKVYEPVSKDALTGRVAENNTPVEVNYQPKLSNNALNYQPKVNGQPIGNPIEVVPSNSQIGTPYNVAPKDITVDGKVYEPVSKDALTGRTTESNTPIEVEYRAKQGNDEISYQPKFNGDNLGTPVSVKDQITDKQEGANFEITPNSEITVDNKVYKLKTPTDKVSGTITQSPQTKEIEYVAKDSNNNLVYQPKLNGNTLGDTIEITPITQIGTPYEITPKDITVDGKVYEPVSKDALTGRVSENNTPIEVNYQPKLSNNALNYQPKVNGENIGTPIEVVPSNSQVGTPYTVIPKDITVNGRVYEPVSKDALTGRTTETNTPLEVEYRAKQGNDEISYQPKFNGNNLGTPVSVKDQITDKQEGANFEVSPNNEITIDDKVYKLKTLTDKVSGTITQSPQTKEIEYVAKDSNNNLVYQPKLTGNDLGTPIEITPIAQIGTPYTVIPKDITVDGKVYEPVSKDALTGRVSENNTSLEVNYQPKLSNNALNYQPKVNGQAIGTPIEIVPSNSQVGTPYEITPKEITIDGKVYEPVVKDNLTGRTTEANTPIEIEYREKQGNSEISYQPKLNGDNLGTPISVKDQITDKQEGANFEVSPNNEITVDNKVYKLKTPTDKVSGTITQSPQKKEIEYVAKDSNNNLVYQPKFNGSNLGDSVEITPIAQIGTPYNVIPKEITIDEKVYEPVSKDALTGRVSENNTPIEVNYQPKVNSNALNYQPKVNGENTGTPIEVVPSNSQIGTPYELTPKDITVNGRVYEPVSKNTLTGRTTEANTPIEVEYRAKQGNDEISYQPKFNGNNLGEPVSVKDQITDKQEGANFEISPKNEITIDNKVYKLKTPTDKVSGTITQSPQTKEIEYVEKNSNNTLVYQPKVNGENLGDNIEITPIAQIGTPYNVIPKEITVDGKVYEPVSKDALTGRVSENNTPIEVSYQPKLSNKALNYQPKVNGQAIGKPIEVVPSNSQVGTPYELTPKEITIDGKVYEPVIKDKLTGRTTEDNTPIEVEYRVKQGNDEISYQPKVNNENLGTPISIKGQITDKQEGANFEVSPNIEITVDSKVYKLKTPTDKVSGTITQSPQVKEVEYIAKNSNNNLGYQPKFNGTNLGDSIEIVPIAQIGTPYNVIPKEITIDGKVYEPVSKDALTGRVSENNSPIEVNYQPKLNSKALEYQPKVNGKELRKPIEILPSNSQIGTPYNVFPKKLLIDGKLYTPTSKEALTGKLLENNELINVEYKESKDYNDTFKQFKEIEKDVIYVSADKDKKVAYDKELENLSNLLKGEKDPSDIEKSVTNLEKLKEALNGKANLLKAIEKAKEEISKLTYIISQSDPILDMLDEPSIIDVEEITHIVEDAKELNNTVKEIVEVLDKHNENEVDYKKSTPEKKEEYNKKAKEILELLKDKNLTKEKALEKVKELNKVSDNLDGIENKQKQDAAISEIEKNTDLPKEVKEKLIKEIENTTSSKDLNKLLDKGKFIDKEIKENKNILSKQVNVANLSDKDKEEYNKALKDYENALSNPNSTKEDIEKAKATLLKFIKEKNEVQFAKGMPAILEKEEAFILEYKDENNKVIKTSIFPISKKADNDLLYTKELTSDTGDKYIRNSNNTYSLVVSNSKPLENKKEKSVVDEDNNNVKPITDKKDVVSTDKEVKTDNKESTIKKEELPKTSSSMLSTLGLFSIFGLRKNRKKDKQ